MIGQIKPLLDPNRLVLSFFRQFAIPFHQIAGPLRQTASGKYIAYRSAEAKDKLSDGAWLVGPDEIWLLDLETDRQFPLVTTQPQIMSLRGALGFCRSSLLVTRDCFDGKSNSPPRNDMAE